ncbi:DUF3678 domain-containing protein [Bacteroides eggerthii]|uniref:DUF3678 domain-containing protein n=1 Tax=Bacteroides eggerthii TaxID=28111 RepID=A0A414M1Z1_9BACE|nr:DUF3678 domain-containing protein [Bacteroides eggerthii]KAA5285728.1 DUF3678 domain-containing protein [Bacteroides eggerthii]MBT9881793.1 DUF3678 domain-containing protein [Bacteroides eggerthii]RGU00258.1 DUF3678 domain-containing protein [Bacteroides eggerthii]RHB00281.1 DUF3678 domain-containing protein [Bacteroides eggerthii]
MLCWVISIILFCNTLWICSMLHLQLFPFLVYISV